MARWGISGAPIPSFVPFYEEIEKACGTFPDDFPPCFLAAIKWNETGASKNPTEMQAGTWPGSDYLTLPDGSGPDVNANAGHGIFQLTSSWPANWADPYANAKYALDTFLAPAVMYWVGLGMTGDTLIKCAAASYNSGLGASIANHAAGDVDSGTTNGYGARAVVNYHALLNGRTPP